MTRSGREVYDAHGVTRIVAVKHNGRKPVYRVTLRNGQFVEATADHVVKAVRERRTTPQWLRVDELEVGMRMHLHPHRAKVGERTLAAAGGFGYLPLDDAPEPAADPVDVAEAALAGWLQADGFVGQYEKGSNRSLTIEFQVANDDECLWVLDHLASRCRTCTTMSRDVESQDDRLDGAPHPPVRRGAAAVRRALGPAGARHRHARPVAAVHRLTRRESSPTSAASSRPTATCRSAATHGCESARVGFAVIGERWTEDVQLLLNAGRRLLAPHPQARAPGRPA